MGKNAIVHIGLGHVVFVVALTRTKVFPLILTSEGNNVMLEVAVAVVADETIQVVVGNKTTAQVQILVTCLVKGFDVLARLDNVRNDQGFLTFSEGSECHLFAPVCQCQYMYCIRVWVYCQINLTRKIR